MESKNTEVKKSSAELKHLGFVKEIAVKIMVLLSNFYDFVKENSGELKAMILSSETSIVSKLSILSPVYEELKEFPNQIIEFVDTKFDTYAPTLVKRLTAQIQSLMKKLIPLIEQFLTIAGTISAPLVGTILSLLHKSGTTTHSLLNNNNPSHLLTTTTSAIRSVPLVGKAAQSLITNPLHLANKFLNTTKSAVGNVPIVGKSAQSLITNPLDLANKFVSGTKSAVGNVPIVGKSAQSLITNPLDLANKFVNGTKSAIGNIPIVGKSVQSLITNPLDLANNLVDTTKSLADNIPVVGQVADKVLDTTTSLVKDSPILNAANTLAQNAVKEAQNAGTMIALKSAYASFKLVALPAIAEFWYKANKNTVFHFFAGLILPAAEYLSELYNKGVSYMYEKGCNLFSYFPLVPIDEMKAAYKAVKMAMDGLSLAGNLAGLGHNDN